MSRVMQCVDRLAKIEGITGLPQKVAPGAQFLMDQAPVFLPASQKLPESTIAAAVRGQIGALAGDTLQLGQGAASQAAATPSVADSAAGLAATAPGVTTVVTSETAAANGAGANGGVSGTSPTQVGGTGGGIDIFGGSVAAPGAGGVVQTQVNGGNGGGSEIAPTSGGIPSLPQVEGGGSLPGTTVPKLATTRNAAQEALVTGVEQVASETGRAIEMGRGVANQVTGAINQGLQQVRDMFLTIQKKIPETLEFVLTLMRLVVVGVLGLANILILMFILQLVNSRFFLLSVALALGYMALFFVLPAAIIMKKTVVIPELDIVPEVPQLSQV